MKIRDSDFEIALEELSKGVDILTNTPLNDIGDVGTLLYTIHSANSRVKQYLSQK